MSNTNTNLQTQTSNALHNSIMEAGGKDRPSMLAPGNYVQWKSRPNNELIHYCLQNPPYKFKFTKKTVPVAEGSLETTTKGYMENYKNVSQDIRDQLNVEAEAFLLQLQPEWKRFVTLVKQSQELKTVSYHKLSDILKQHENKVNEIRAERLVPATRNKGKATVNSSPPIYDQEPTMVAEDDEMSKDKEIDKLMALISLSFKKIYKPTNNNLKTSSNTSRENHDNTPRINRGIGKGMLETKIGKECSLSQGENAIIQEVTSDAADNSGPIFNVEPLQKVQNNDDNYNVFAIEREHPEQCESVNDTYLVEQDEHNIIIGSLDMSYDREQVDHDDNDDLAKERDLLASLIEKLKCEINDSKNRNKFLETSNNALVDKLKSEIEDFNTKNKSL
ncbi:hypothetical protein Tco_0531248 [Tanacetum coccineum]